MANNDSGYTKKCKHFLMVLNYIKEQIALGQIEARKIYGKLNNADMHTKPLRSSDFSKMANKILVGQPDLQLIDTLPSPPILPAENKSVSDLGVESQPSNERKLCNSHCFGFDNGCRGKCACSLVDRQMICLLGMRRYVPPTNH